MILVSRPTRPLPLMGLLVQGQTSTRSPYRVATNLRLRLDMALPQEGSTPKPDLYIYFTCTASIS